MLRSTTQYQETHGYQNCCERHRINGITTMTGAPGVEVCWGPIALVGQKINILPRFLKFWAPSGMGARMHASPDKIIIIVMSQHSMNAMKLVIPLYSWYWSIHTKDESKCRTTFALIFGANRLWHCGVTASFGVFFFL